MKIMKKILLVLFLFLACYLIYIKTEKPKLNITAIGDTLAKTKYLQNNQNITTYNTTYTNPNYRIIDLINIFKYNQEIEDNNQTISIHRLLKNTDILIISAGLNDLTNQSENTTKNIYTHLNEIINNMEILLEELSKYYYQEVIILGYYHTKPNQNDIYTYLNYKLQKIANKYNYHYINLDQIFKNNPNYLDKTTNNLPNSEGYRQINQIIVEKLKNY